ncbi:hypothetical protein FB451DRAFT_1225751 [Mycena latifolia]|nr:hypothetical protein FB451DRAFT_1225751 [Mycena latifolia]
MKRFSSRLFLVFSPTFPCMRNMSLSTRDLIFGEMLIIGTIRAGSLNIYHCAFFRQICHYILVGDSPGPSYALETVIWEYWCRSVIRES